MWHLVGEGQQTEQVRRGNDVAVVAFVPALSRRDLHQSAYWRAAGGPAARAAFQLLFWSGNPSPPARFEHPSDFERFHDLKQFRGTAGIAGVEVSLDNREEIVGASFNYLAAPGFTRLGSEFRPGIGQSAFEAEINTRFLAIRLQSFFKLGGFADRSQALLTRHRAPYAWVCLDYVLRRDGFSGLRSHASAIPSFCYYLDWNLADGGHDMLSNERFEIEAFIAAGACVSAPDHFAGEWPGGVVLSDDERAAFAGLTAPGTRPVRGRWMENGWAPT